MTYFFNDIYINESYTLVSNLEMEGPLKNYFDYNFNLKSKTFEFKEINALKVAIDLYFEKYNKKAKDYDFVISSDLSNELAITNYTYRSIEIPVIPIYAACSSFTLDLGVASLLLSNDITRLLVTISSNKEVAERQFRNPIEYGGPKELTQSTTATGSAIVEVSKKKSEIKLKAFTMGKIIDVGYKNALDFGRVMAPAAVEALIDHFNETMTKPKDYDLILTGDLGIYGNKLVEKALSEKYGYIHNLSDAGVLLYDRDNQDVCAGGSGPVAIALVFLAYIKKKIQQGIYKRVLLAATGALLSVTLLNQNESIPAVCHVIEIVGEV